MGAIATLQNETLGVEPGGEVLCAVKVRNNGKVVDEFRFTVLGDAAGWAAVEPTALSLMPGSEGVAEVRFKPPRSSDTKAGSVPFGLRVASKEDPAGSVVEEGTLEVGRFADVFAELVPRTSRGRGSARHELAFDNRGNILCNAEVSAADADNQLLFEFEPPAVSADPNTAVFGKVRVKPKKKFLKGPPKTHLFKVTVRPDGALPITADGTYHQEALIPKWTNKALLAVALLALAWFMLLRPTVKSAARQAVEKPLAKQEAKVTQLAAAIAPAAAAAAAAGQIPAAPAAATGLAALGDPFDRRLAVNAKPDATDTQAYTVGKEQVFSLSDIVLQNPLGVVGTLEIRRDDAVLLHENLANFRDLDYHFVSSVVFTEGQKLVLFVQCGSPAGGPDCTPSAYVAGFLKKTAPPA
jgi:hypothetical protein